MTPKRKADLLDNSSRLRSGKSSELQKLEFRMDLSASLFVCNHSVNKGSYVEMKAHKRTLCQVCGSVAKGSLILVLNFTLKTLGVYYTATSCKSCMDFFRRCVIFDKKYKVSKRIHIIKLKKIRYLILFEKTRSFQCVGITRKQKCIEGEGLTSFKSVQVNSITSDFFESSRFFRQKSKHSFIFLLENKIQYNLI